jgi:hypothetical protein
MFSCDISRLNIAKLQDFAKKLKISQQLQFYEIMPTCHIFCTVQFLIDMHMVENPGER